MNKKSFVLIVSIASIMSFVGFQFLIEPPSTNTSSQVEIKKTKLDIKSLFNIYGYGENFEIKDGKKVWSGPKFELNPENDELYPEIRHTSENMW